MFWCFRRAARTPGARFGLGSGSVPRDAAACGVGRMLCSSPGAEPPRAAGSSFPKVFNFEKLQEKKTWIAAQEFCRELGAQLLSLGSYEEEHFVANTLNKIFG